MLIVSSGAQLDGVSWMYLIRYCQLDKDSMLTIMIMMMILMMMMMIWMMMMMKMEIVEQVLVPKVNYSLELIQAS